MKTIEPFLGSAHFIKRNSITNMKRKYLCYKILFQNFSHGLGFKGPSHPKTSVVKLILDDENKLIWIFNPKPRLFQVNDDTYNIKICSLSICDLPQCQVLDKRGRRHGKIAQHALPTKIKGFQFQLVTQPIVNIIVTRSSRWTWLHHHLIQFAQKKVVIFNYGQLIFCYYRNKVQMKKHM